ncbi:helix-turn-helix transcriptional regulator [Chitinophaga varians]|uniref:helix-turn-helix transcriptional regulator n=1 Tax=Chitinophaga varians TaxID=2202339 RepID=UPI00165EFA50|nr:helix-turn-helix transcriptional regulator [Chitinophaga varians]MBC9911132.1 helix-turn-helix transcriptional regulator [Chitinophaga varians]
MKINYKSTLSWLRKRKCYTQQQVADYVHVSRPTYVSWEQNTGDLPLSKMMLLAQLYEMTLTQFVNLILAENDMPPAEQQSEGDVLLMNISKDVAKIKEMLSSISPIPPTFE